jgi:hypothetical protein
MYQVSLAAGNDFPDVQLRLMSSPTSYMPSCPVIRGPSSGRAVMIRVIERKVLKMCRVRREQCAKRNRERFREKGTKSGETSTKKSADYQHAQCSKGGK